MKPVMTTALGLALAGCTTTAGSREAVTVVIPEQGGELVRQCSRTGPEGAHSFFTPRAREITAVETATAKALRGVSSQDYISPRDSDLLAFDWPDDPSLYNRQYVGYVRDGRRKIYGNFVPTRFGPSSSEPVVVCDGGPSLFGVEFDILSGTVERIAFNGGRGGPFFPDIEPD